ncbi:hypothetical protein [Sinorhizobium fredii]|uniref:Uncharacterized protein n=1 Tax=Sinorhizobium fredii (strain HH103) TaxID=1117943 RepID=A0A0A8WJY9_SINF1|nr:hypothetical protein [Sinorhizobium fredii]CEL26562.1 hypothetical protein [Sinorhizobium fredii HH103]
MSKAEAFRQLSVDALEEYARAVLDPKTILDEAAKSAAQGECMHAVAIDRPLELSQTDAGKKFAATMQEHGFRLEWAKRSVIVGAVEKIAWTLIVRW